MRTVTMLAVVALLAVSCGGSSPGTLQPQDLVSPGGDAIEGDAPDAAVPDVPLADGQTCRPGAAQCMGSVLLMCNAAGTDWVSVPCPQGTTCSPQGCIGGGDSGPGPDVPVVEDVPPIDDVPAPTDTPKPTDPGTPPQDVPVVSDPGTPPADVPPVQCGNQVCDPDEECCQTPMGPRCFPAGQCPGQPPQNCQTDQDCSNGQKCCPPMFPGGQSRCEDSCQGGGGNLPTCETDADCTGGQTCLDLYLTSLCVSACESDADCGGATCKEIGAMGYVLAKVCDCGSTGACNEPLVCCEIPYVNQQTCLTECPSF